MERKVTGSAVKVNMTFFKKTGTRHKGKTRHKAQGIRHKGKAGIKAGTRQRRGQTTEGKLD